VLKEFKAFILRGNVVDLAVGIVIGAAFATLIGQLTASFITPLLALPGDAGNFSRYSFEISGSTFAYGAFIDAIIVFLITAAAIFFFVVKPVNTLMARRKTEPDVESPTKECTECLSSIPAGAKRCPFCTSPQ
jgi:large conductance mechanosensitive channel